MAIRAAKCPSCGANLNIDEGRKKAFCEYCGSPFIVEDAINNFIGNNTVNVGSVGTLNVNSDQTADARIEAGEAYLKLEKYPDALYTFDEACKLKPQDYRSYWGKIRSLTNGLNKDIAYSSMSKYGVVILHHIKDMIAFLPREKKDDISSKITIFMNEAIAQTEAVIAQENNSLESNKAALLEYQKKITRNLLSKRLTIIIGVIWEIISTIGVLLLPQSDKLSRQNAYLLLAFFLSIPICIIIMIIITNNLSLKRIKLAGKMAKVSADITLEDKNILLNTQTIETAKQCIELLK